MNELIDLFYSTENQNNCAIPNDKIAINNNQQEYTENDINQLDELPYWSAPFGIDLLHNIKLQKEINILDIGSGTGFPLVELAAMFGHSCTIYGIDPWYASLHRIKSKIEYFNINNIKIIDTCAEELPFEDNTFSLITSNNGLNNVSNLPQVLSECYRTAKENAQLVFTFNLPETMLPFYEAFEQALKMQQLDSYISLIKEHIWEKRKKISEMTDFVNAAKFNINNIIEKQFLYRFNDAESFFNHHFIKRFFLPVWENLIPSDKIHAIFEIIANILNKNMLSSNEISMPVPYACFVCSK